MAPYRQRAPLQPPPLGQVKPELATSVLDNGACSNELKRREVVSRTHLILLDEENVYSKDSIF